MNLHVFILQSLSLSFPFSCMDPQCSLLDSLFGSLWFHSANPACARDWPSIVTHSPFTWRSWNPMWAWWTSFPPSLGPAFLRSSTRSFDSAWEFIIASWAPSFRQVSQALFQETALVWTLCAPIPAVYLRSQGKSNPITVQNSRNKRSPNICMCDVFPNWYYQQLAVLWWASYWSVVEYNFIMYLSTRRMLRNVSTMRTSWR